VSGPTSVPRYNYYAPVANLESFLIDRLSPVLDLRHETQSIEEFIADFLHFSDFNDNENILEKLESLKR